MKSAVFALVGAALLLLTTFAIAVVHISNNIKAATLPAITASKAVETNVSFLPQNDATYMTTRKFVVLEKQFVSAICDTCSAALKGIVLIIREKDGNHRTVFYIRKDSNPEYDMYAALLPNDEISFWAAPTQKYTPAGLKLNTTITQTTYGD